MKRTCIQIGFACFGSFAALDAVILVSSEVYREIFGRTDGLSDIWNISRLGIDGSMVFFYMWVYLKMKKGGVLPRVMVGHGLLYGLLGLAVCVPWVGWFLTPLTPIAWLYLGSILLTPLGYPGALGVAGAFVAYNIWLVWAGLTTNIVSRTRVS